MNTGSIVRFQNGGFIEIDGTAIVNVEGPGLQRIAPGIRARIRRMDGASLAPSVVGDERPTRVEIEVAATYNATNPFEILAGIQNEVSNQQLVPLEIKCGWLAEQGGSDYTTWTFNKCELVEDSVELRQSREGYDVWSFAFEHLGPLPDPVDETIV